MSTLFISDLHLSDQRPDLTRAFVDFVKTEAMQAETLYILGDFFDAWIGDDAVTPTAAAAIEALQSLHQAGIPVFIQWGNRDFLLGDTFMQQTGATLLPEIATIKPYQQQLLIMHGDELCTDDVDYQALRVMLRNPAWQQDFLSKPLPERIALAQQLREKSKDAQQDKAEYITDVHPDAVAAAFAEYSCDIMIHGHTHRPQVHRLDNHKTRIVLGDWDTSGWCLEWRNDDSYELRQFSL